MDTTTRKNIIDTLTTTLSGDTKGHALRYAEQAHGVNHIQFMDAIHEMWEGETLSDQSDDTLTVLDSILN